MIYFIFRMGPKKKNTRQASKLLVSPCELPVADLPTLREILGKCTTEKNKLPNNSSIEAVLPGVVKDLKEFYKKVNSNLVVLHHLSTLGIYGRFVKCP